MQIPSLPGRTYKGWSKYWNAFAAIIICLFITYKIHPAQAIALYLIGLSIFTPIIIAFRWKPLIKETYLDRNEVKIKYDSGKIEKYPLKECVWFIEEARYGAGRGYSYRVNLFHTVAVDGSNNLQFEIKLRIPVAHFYTPMSVKLLIRKAHSISALEIPIMFETKQIERDYEAGNFVKT